MTPRRELRTCPVEGRTVLINPAIPAVALQPRSQEPSTSAIGWAPRDPPWVGVEGETTVTRAPAVYRDALGAHERIQGDLPAALLIAGERMADLRGDLRLRSFKLAGRAHDGVCGGLDLVALPFETPISAPARWRDEEIGRERCVDVQDGAVAFLAWAPRTAAETWVMPRLGSAAFAKDNVGPVARLAVDLLGRLHVALPGVDVDVVLVDGEPWRLELRPRFERDAIYTTATDMDAHGSFPEHVAAFLQDFTP